MRHNKNLEEIKLNNSSRYEQGEESELSAEERSALKKTYLSSMITAAASVICCFACLVTFTVAAFRINVTGSVGAITTANFTVAPTFVEGSGYSTLGISSASAEVPFDYIDQMGGWKTGVRYVISANPSGNTPVGWYGVTVTYPDVNGATDENGNAVYHTQRYAMDYSYDPFNVSAHPSVTFVTFIEGTTVTVEGNWGSRPEEFIGQGWSSYIQVGTPEDAFKAALNRGDSVIYLTDPIVLSEDLTVFNDLTLSGLNGGTVVTIEDGVTINASAALVLDGVSLTGSGNVRTQPLVNVNDNGSLVLSYNSTVSGFRLANNVNLLSAVNTQSGNAPVITINGGSITDNELGEGSYPLALYNGAVLMANAGTISNNTYNGEEMALYSNIPYSYTVGTALVSGYIEQPDPYAQFLLDITSGKTEITLQYPFTVTDNVSVSGSVTLSSATASPVIITVAKGGSFDIYEGGLVLNGIVLTGDDQTRDAPLVTVHDGGVLNLGHNAGIRNFALASETDIITASGSRASVIFNGGSVADNTLGVNSYPVRLTSGAIASVNLGGIHSNLCGETEVALYTDTKNTYMPSPDVLVSGEVKIDAATPYEEFLAAIGRGDPTIILTDNFTVTEDIVIASNTVITSADASAPAVLSFAPDATVTVNSGLTLVGVKLYDGTGTVRTAPIFSVVDGGSLTLGENAYICDFTTAENVHLIELLHLTEGTAPYVMLSGGFIMDNILGEGAYPVSLMGGSVLNANTGSITNNFSAGVEVAILRDEASIYNAGEAIVNGAVTAPVAEESEEAPSEGEGQTSSEQEGAEVPADENTQTDEELPAEENSQSRDEPDGAESDTPSADADTGNDAQAQ